MRMQKRPHYVIMGSLTMNEDGPSIKDIVIPASSIEEVQQHLQALVQYELHEIAELYTFLIGDPDSPEYNDWVSRPKLEQDQDVEIAHDPDMYYRTYFKPLITKLTFFNDLPPNQSKQRQYIDSHYTISSARLFDNDTAKKTILQGKINYYVIRYVPK